MEKAELINYLRHPNELSKGGMRDLNQVIKDYPYFLSARVLLAKRCKSLELPVTKKMIASASIYATDRVLLKKYIDGDLFYLHPPTVEEEKTVEISNQENDALPSLEIPTIGNYDAMLEELQRDMEELKLSREKFVEVQSKIDEEIETSSKDENNDILSELGDEDIDLAISLAVEKALKKKIESL